MSAKTKKGIRDHVGDTVHTGTDAFHENSPSPLRSSICDRTFFHTPILYYVFRENTRYKILTLSNFRFLQREAWVCVGVYTFSTASVTQSAASSYLHRTDFRTASGIFEKLYLSVVAGEDEYLVSVRELCQNSQDVFESFVVKSCERIVEHDGRFFTAEALRKRQVSLRRMRRRTPLHSGSLRF